MRAENFAWICTWKITHRCNLSCTYCDYTVMRPASAIEKNDYDSIVDRLRRYAPKIVNISGGEPTLVGPLPDIVRKMKEGWGPFIRIVHNGTQPAKAAGCFPFIDRFVVSIDGPGRLNRETRGIDGGAVIRKLAEVLGEAREHGVETAVNCVVTVRNLRSLAELAHAVRRASESILLSFTPVIPPHDGVSILNSKQHTAEFLATYDTLKRGGFNVTHTFDGLVRHGTFSRIQCFNQFFTIRVNPEGRISACPMNAGLRDGLTGVPLKKLLSPRGLRKAAAAAGRYLRGRAGARIDFSCSTICNCESWLDMLFLGRECESARTYLRGLHGRLTEKDYRDMAAFVRTHINPGFDPADFRRRVEAAA